MPTSFSLRPRDACRRTKQSRPVCSRRAGTAGASNETVLSAVLDELDRGVEASRPITCQNIEVLLISSLRLQGARILSPQGLWPWLAPVLSTDTCLRMSESGSAEKKQSVFPLNMRTEPHGQTWTRVAFTEARKALCARRHQRQYLAADRTLWPHVRGNLGSSQKNLENISRQLLLLCAEHHDQSKPAGRLWNSPDLSMASTAWNNRCMLYRGFEKHLLSLALRGDEMMRLARSETRYCAASRFGPIRPIAYGMNRLAQAFSPKPRKHLHRRKTNLYLEGFRVYLGVRCILTGLQALGASYVGSVHNH